MNRLLTCTQVKLEKEKIDKLSYEDMAMIYRFATPAHKYRSGDVDVVAHFDTRFYNLGGWTEECWELTGGKKE